jgi:hypothetical protein
MNKKLKLLIVLLVLAMSLSTMQMALAAAPDKFPLADGILLEDVITNQFTVVSVGEVPDPAYAKFDAMMDGQNGMVKNTIREVVLKDQYGSQQTITLGKEVKNFDQIEVGDKVTLTIEREVAIFLGKEGQVPGMGDAKMTFSAPKGSKPGGLQVKQAFLTLEILKLNADKKEVTVRLPDNSVKTVSTPRVDFASLKVGQNVIVMQKSEQSILVTAP